MGKSMWGIRPMDAVLALATSAIAVYLMVESIKAGADADLRIDSHSWWMVPVFLAATLPVLWRRRYTLGVTLVAGAAMAVHVAAFGWGVRCGAGLPLAFVLAYAAGRFVRDRGQSALTMTLTLGVQAIVLVRDSAAGLAILPVTAVIGLAIWGIGRFVQSRNDTRPARADDTLHAASYR
jgi:hypothetical protein